MVKKFDKKKKKVETSKKTVKGKTMMTTKIDFKNPKHRKLIMKLILPSMSPAEKTEFYKKCEYLEDWML